MLRSGMWILARWLIQCLHPVIKDIVQLLDAPLLMPEEEQAQGAFLVYILE